MRRSMLALCLIAGPALAQDDTVLPPDGGLHDAYGNAPHLNVNSDFVQIIDSALQDAGAQATAIDLAMARMKVPAALAVTVRAHLAALLAEVVVREEIAAELAVTFVSMGMTPSNPDVMARLAGEQLPVWRQDWIFAGLSRLPAADRAAGLALHLRLAGAAGAQDCADYLSDLQVVGQTRRMQMEIMAGWPAAEAEAALALMRRAMLAEAAAGENFADLTYAELSQVDLAAGRAILLAMDATGDPARLYAAFGYPEQATAEDICTARLTMLEAVQAMPGPEGALVLRYVTSYGLNE